MNEQPPPDGRAAKWILLLALFLALAARLAAGQEAAEPAAEAVAPAEAPDDVPAESLDAQPAARAAPPSLYAQSSRALVEVLVKGHLDGSGFFVDPEGLLCTAAHVVKEPGRPIEVLSPVAGRRDATVVAVDLGHDLALLRVEPREGGYPALRLAEKLPPPGEDVYLLGAPLFRHAVLFPGTVARDATVFEYYTERYVEVLHVASTAPGGVSGGPWINRAGEVIGLQSAVMSLNSIPVGIADAVPVGAIRCLLKRRRNASTATLGAAVEEPWQQDQKLLGRFPPKTEGLLLKSLTSDGPAERAGLRQFDLIQAADGRKVRLVDELLRIIRSKRPGQQLKLSVLAPDGTGQREVKVTLGHLEVGWPQPDK